jgi:hypothetical protein
MKKLCPIEDNPQIVGWAIIFRIDLRQRVFFEMGLNAHG